jgi:hypothetical protein
LPTNEEINADECRNSLKRAFNMKNTTEEQQQQNSNIKHVITITNGIAGL